MMNQSQSASATRSAPPPAAVAEDVTVRRGGRDILTGVSCELHSGRCTALLGPNGCGKTTFARVLTGHMFPTSGRVEVLGQTLGKTDIRTLRRRIGVVNPALDTAGGHVPGAVVDGALSATEAVTTGFFGTVGLYDRPSELQIERSRTVLAEVGLASRTDQRFEKLSTGEQRRAIIARALVHQPELLILDEPTAGLDLAGREQVLATIERLLAQKNPPAVLMITHHVEEISPRTEQVLLMRQGVVAASGKPEQVMTPESLSQLFGCRVYVRRVHGRYWVEVLPEAWLDLLP
jgi:iron complex transport system ATP-binding protein